MTSLTLLQGNMNLGTHDLSATTVTLGDIFAFNEATLGLAGTLTGSVDVNVNGNLAPGGVGTVGTLLVTGDVNFNDGDFAVDFGPGGTADKLLVSGNVDISGSSELGGGLGTGQLTAGLVVVIDASGNLTGEFSNAATGVPVLVGTDAVTATYTSKQVIIQPFNPPNVGAIAVGFDPIDLTGFKAILTGGGQVLTGTDSLGRMFLVARNTTPLSKLVITTIANASDDIVTFDAGVLISGPLALFSAPKIDIGNQFRASGAVTVATFRDLIAGGPGGTVEFGGVKAQLTTISARNIFGKVSTGSTLNSLKVAKSFGLFDSTISAPAIGSVKTGTFLGTVQSASLLKFETTGGTAKLRTTGAIGSIIARGEFGMTLNVSASKVGAVKIDSTLFGDGDPATLDWNVAGGITSLTAGAIGGVDLEAKFLGVVLVKGNTTFGLSGNVQDSTFTLKGNDGTLAKYGLKSLTAKGNVVNSRFDIEGGNVGVVTVGRFHDSKMWVGYTPNSSGDFLLGTITSSFRLAGFKTTAIPTTDPNHPLNWAFKNSEIVADSIGTVTLSGLQTDNSGVAFGIKVGKPGAIVLVVKADVTNDPDLPLNVNLAPDKSPPFTSLANDFYYLDV